MENGGSLAFVSEELRADRGVARAAVKTASNLQFASEEIRADRRIVIEAMKYGAQSALGVGLHGVRPWCLGQKCLGTANAPAREGARGVVPLLDGEDGVGTSHPAQRVYVCEFGSRILFRSFQTDSMDWGDPFDPPARGDRYDISHIACHAAAHSVGRSIALLTSKEGCAQFDALTETWSSAPRVARLVRAS